MHFILNLSGTKQVNLFTDITHDCQFQPGVIDIYLFRKSDKQGY